jgi:hypothetical protein
VKKTDGKAGTLSKVVEITKPAAEIRFKIQQQTKEIRKVESLRSVEKTLENYIDVLEENAIYLAELEQENLQPVIESNIQMAVNINRWLMLFGRN